MQRLGGYGFRYSALLWLVQLQAISFLNSTHHPCVATMPIPFGSPSKGDYGWNLMKANKFSPLTSLIYLPHYTRFPTLSGLRLEKLCGMSLSL